jgi:hypothetical protein
MSERRFASSAPGLDVPEPFPEVRLEKLMIDKHPRSSSVRLFRSSSVDDPNYHFHTRRSLTEGRTVFVKHGATSAEVRHFGRGVLSEFDASGRVYANRSEGGKSSLETGIFFRWFVLSIGDSGPGSGAGIG